MTVSWADAVVFVSVLLLVEISLYFRLKPMQIQLATIEHLLRSDQSGMYQSLGDHEERIVGLEAQFEEHLRGHR